MSETATAAAASYALRIECAEHNVEVSVEGSGAEHPSTRYAAGYLHGLRAAEHPSTREAASYALRVECAEQNVEVSVGGSGAEHPSAQYAFGYLHGLRAAAS